MASRIQRELALVVTGKDVGASKTLKSVNKEIGKLGAISGKAGSNIARNLEHGVAVGAAATVGALGYAVKAAMDWESAVAGVAKTVDGDIATITAGIRDMSREVPLGAVELAGLAESAGALGIAKGDILAFTKVAATLGITTNVSADEAATALGQMGTILNLHAGDFERFGSALVDLGNKGNSTEAQILEITRRAGSAAKLLGIAADKTLGWSAAMANLGMQDELAGTALQTFMVKSLALVSNGGGDLKEMAKIAGTTSAAFKKAFGKDASGALQSFIAGLAKLPKDRRLAAVQDLFGKTSGLNRGILGLADSYARNLAPSIDTATDAWADNSAMAAEAEKRYATTASQMTILENNVKDAAVTIGTALLPVVNELAAQGVDWLQGHQAEIADFAQDLAKGIRDAVTWAEKLDWDAIGAALHAGADGAKFLIDAFLNAPPWLQQFLAVGFVANKFTGGAVGDIVGELGKGLIKGVLGMNAGVVNINAGVVNGAGGAAGGAAAAGGTLINSLVKGLLGGGLVLGGQALQGAGVNTGGPAGAAQAAGGAAMTIGGAALLFGPIGAAIAAPLTAIATGIEVNNKSSAQAAGVRQTADVWLQQSPSLNDLKNGLAAVDQGINEIQSNPLNMLVAGDALEQLRATRAGIVNAIATVSDNTVRTVAATERAEANMSAKELATATATRDVRASVEANRIAQQAGFASAAAAEAATGQKVANVQAATLAAGARAAAAAASAGLLTAGAINRKDLSVTTTFAPTIVTSVSVRETIATRTTYKQYQKTAS